MGARPVSEAPDAASVTAWLESAGLPPLTPWQQQIVAGMWGADRLGSFPVRRDGYAQWRRAWLDDTGRGETGEREL